MAEQSIEQTTLGEGTSSSTVKKRRSYTREEKLKVVRFYFDNGKNLSAKDFR